ncbi:hypothetical protein [Comamonas sp. CMM02]|uniref:hypothetical protein n=1 Tax=Comamonas sp. CMM02 TaxID=2769307 RepID=UPI00177FA4A1|nr:hypothetical protein [Comamonas sp. CMM02]MBD9400818.1 hypothetical protein [Comamonas sp. CMM02]
MFLYELSPDEQHHQRKSYRTASKYAAQHISDGGLKMFGEMSCWSVDWTAIGAVLAGVGTVTAAITAGVALHVGMEPRRLQQEKERRRAVVAASLLLTELTVLRTLGNVLADENFDNKKLSHVKEKAEVSASLKCPNLKNCLDMADSYPEKLAKCMGTVFALASAIDLQVQHMPYTELDKKNKEGFRVTVVESVKATDTLRSELKKYISPQVG